MSGSDDFVLPEGTDEDDVAYLSFAQQRETALRGDGWLQGRYYSETGVSVKTFLSFGTVFDICPFEVGVDRRAEKRAYRMRFAKVARLLELADLLPRAFQTLSNGEMRRVLFARALLRNPKVLVLDDPMAGLDPVHRKRFRRILGALRRDGVDVRVRCPYGDDLRDHSDGEPDFPAERAPKRIGTDDAPAVIELKDVSVRFGRRRLFDGFSWTVRRGERWVLRGRNGSGKSTLLALVTGDSPLGYANDVTVFGQKREPGRMIAEVRRRIGMVSPEMQTYLGKNADDLLSDALAAEPELLLLDEPCLNLDAKAARALCRRVGRWLRERPRVTAICVAHRPDHVPRGFDLVMDLDKWRHP